VSLHSSAGRYLKFILSISIEQKYRDTRYYRDTYHFSTKFIPYPAAKGGGGEILPVRFCRKSHSKQWNETAIFCDIVTDPLGFPTQLSVSLYLLPILRGRFYSNVHVTGFATTSSVRP